MQCGSVGILGRVEECIVLDKSRGTVRAEVGDLMFGMKMTLVIDFHNSNLRCSS